jgi:hypothetical protein
MLYMYLVDTPFATSVTCEMNLSWGRDNVWQKLGANSTVGVLFPNWPFCSIILEMDHVNHKPIYMLYIRDKDYIYKLISTEIDSPT